MNWLVLLKAALGLAAVFAKMAERNQLLAAGRALAIAEGISNAQEHIKDARTARNDAVREFDGADGVQDESDPNLRD